MAATDQDDVLIKLEGSDNSSSSVRSHFFRNGSTDFGWFSVCPAKQLRSRNNDLE